MRLSLSAKSNYSADADNKGETSRKRATDAAMEKSCQTFLRRKHDGEGKEAGDTVLTPLLVATGPVLWVRRGRILGGLAGLGDRPPDMEA